MRIFKKKTLNEVAKADAIKDYTDGYKFLPWLFWKNRLFTFGALPIGLIILIAGIVHQSLLTVCIVLGLFIIYYVLLKLDYNNLKKGNSK